MKKQLKIKLSAAIILFGLINPAFTAPHTDESQIHASKSIAKQTEILADQDNDGLSDGLQSRMAAMAASDTIDVIVTFSAAENGQSHAAAAEQAIGSFTLQREFTLIHGFKATMTVGQAQTLSRSPGVFRVQEDGVVTTQLENATKDFGAVAARTNTNVDGSGIGICIVDTGIDASHEQFAGGRIMGFHDSIKGQALPYDDHGHGTHVAAIALGGGGSGDGNGGPGDNSKVIGVAPIASIFSAKVLDALGSGSESQVIEGIQYCASQADVHIISMSLGTAAASDGLDAMSLAVNCVSAPDFSPACGPTTNSPKIVVVAAGNSGSVPQSIGSPGAAEKAITVGAVSNWSGDGRGVYLAAFSSRGPTLDGRIKPDISAPGLRILSAKAGSITDYVNFSGTSMATPFTSGSIALMLQKNFALMGASVPADAVRSLLASSSQDRGVLGAGDSPIKPDNEYGHGLLDVNRAVAMAGGTDAPINIMPGYHYVTGRINNTEGSEFFGPFTITEADIIAGIPFSATVTIEGNQFCGYGDPVLCDLIGGWEWDPDLDVYLLDDKGNIVSGGTDDITTSICPAAGEFCGVGRQETIHYLPPKIFTAAAGEYTIEVKSFSGGGNFLLEVSQGSMGGSAPIPANNDPVAEFTVTCSGLICNFTDYSTDSDGNNTILSWNWDFGNEYGSTLPNPSYTYLAEGNYLVTLLVADDQGATNSISHVVNVTEPVSSSNIAPTAHAGGLYEATISKGKSASVLLDGRGSTDEDGTIVSWFWSQGGQQIASGETTSVNFKEGTHIVRLTVVDDGGLNGVEDTTVTILSKGSDSGSGGGGPDCLAKPNHPKCP